MIIGGDLIERLFFLKKKKQIGERSIGVRRSCMFKRASVLGLLSSHGRQ